MQHDQRTHVDQNRYHNEQSALGESCVLELLPCGSASNLEVVVLELLQTTTVF